MSRDPLLYLEDMVEACEKIRMYVDGVTYERFLSDTMRFDAIVRNIELIGEAARLVPESIRQQMPGVPWREIIRMRNILVHVYFGVDPDVVWSVANDEVLSLEDAVQQYLSTL